MRHTRSDGGLRSLDALFRPKSVAVVGASEDPTKWGYLLATGALKGRAERDVFLVNARSTSMFGEPAYAALDSLPDAPDAVVVAVPPRHFEQVVDQALAVQSKAIIAITAGFSEIDAAGHARQAAVANRVRAHGAVMLGPNCMGVFDLHAHLDLAPWLMPEPPPAQAVADIALISQSGNLGTEIVRQAHRLGLRVSRFASLGNQADLDAAACLEDFAERDGADLIAVYLEDFRSGRDFLVAARRARRNGKRVLVLTVGATAATSRATSSHTGSLATDEDVIVAALESVGATRHYSPRELLTAAAAFATGRRLETTPNVAIVADGGGHGAVAAQLAVRDGLEVPAFSEALITQLREQAGGLNAVSNPVDLGSGGGGTDIRSYATAIGTLLESPEVSGVLLTGTFGGLRSLSPDREDWLAEEHAVAKALAEYASSSGKPLFVHSVYGDSDVSRGLALSGVPVFDDVAQALYALSILRTPERQDVKDSGADIPACSDCERPASPDYWDSRRWMVSHGLAFADARRVTTDSQARRAAQQLGYPLALKGLGILHKSDAGAVKLGITSEPELIRELAAMRERTTATAFVVERMISATEGLEVILGVRRDPRFGPVLLVGFGGIYAEIVRDTTLLLAPATEADIERALRQLKLAPLLSGARGRPPLDVGKLARLASNLSTLAMSHPQITAAELNPVIVTADAAIALDARVLWDDATPE